MPVELLPIIVFPGELLIGDLIDLGQDEGVTEVLSIDAEEGAPLGPQVQVTTDSRVLFLPSGTQIFVQRIM
jgi:hypothetical protein